MRMTDKGFLAAAVILGTAAAGTASARDSWVRINDSSAKYDITRTVQQDYELGKAGEVEVTGIGGNVEVKAVDGTKVSYSYSYERRAATETDFNCEKLVADSQKGRLDLSIERSRDRECRTVRADDKLTLSVPRGTAVSLRQIGDSVRVTGVEGMVSLKSIGDSAVVDGVRQLDADSIGDSLKLTVTQLGEEGIHVASVGDSVSLDLPDALDARLRIDSVGDSIRGPGFKSGGDYETTLGKGGPMIRISSVGDSVVIHGGTPGKGASY